MKIKKSHMLSMGGTVLFCVLSLSGAAANSPGEAVSQQSPQEVTEAEPSFRIITDMADRKVKIPTKIDRVVCTSPPMTTATYMVDPQRLAALGASSVDGAKFIPENLRQLPVFQWKVVGTRRMYGNYESYIALQPDVIIDGCGKNSWSNNWEASISRLETLQSKVGTIPIVCASSDSINFEPMLLLLGDVLNRRQRAEELVKYYRDVAGEIQAKIATLPEDERVRVYYAEGSDGLQTNPAGSAHAALIEFAGGRNVVNSAIKESQNATTVGITKESLLIWNPDVIVTANPLIVQKIYADGTWQKIKAVREHRVCLIPTKPFHWFDRPPGPNRIVGMPWTAHAFYPDLFPEEWFREKAREFYRLYYQYDLSDEELTELMTP